MSEQSNAAIVPLWLHKLQQLFLTIRKIAHTTSRAHTVFDSGVAVGVAGTAHAFLAGESRFTGHLLHIKKARQ